jgi:hypothetical protein
LVEEMTQALLVDPEAADVGMVKNAGAQRTSTWSDVETRRHKPVRMVTDYKNSRHLWGRHVIDAHGINLLTDEHLAAARDLSTWKVEQVSGHRHLVSAHDLEPWYAHNAPDPQTLARARVDFGDMILSWDTILANPGPYTNSDTAIIGR